MYEYRLTRLHDDTAPGEPTEQLIAYGKGSAKSIAAAMRSAADEIDPKPATPPGFNEIFASAVKLGREQQEAQERERAAKGGQR
jgi:DNA-binding NtrC family response regulator